MSVRLAALLWLLFAGVNTARAAHPARVAPDFALSLHFDPGGFPNGRPHQLQAWSVRIDARGQAVQQLFYSGPGRTTVRKRPVRFSAPEMRRLAAVLEREGFFELPDNLDHADDTTVFTLEGRAGGRVHRVSMTGSDFLENKAVVRRVSAVWAAVVEKVPSPDDNRELQFLRQHTK